MTSTKVLSRRAPPTAKSYCDAVSKMIGEVQQANELTDAELAERVRCSAGTISNARNKAGRLAPETLLMFEHEFGTGTIDKISALAGSRNVPINAACTTDANPALSLSAALHVLIEAMRPDSDEGVEVSAKESSDRLLEVRQARRSLDILIEQGEEYLRQRMAA